MLRHILLIFSKIPYFKLERKKPLINHNTDSACHWHRWAGLSLCLYDIAERSPFHTQLSPRNRDNMRKYHGIWIRGPFGIKLWKKFSKKSLDTVPLTLSLNKIKYFFVNLGCKARDICGKKSFAILNKKNFSTKVWKKDRTITNNIIAKFKASAHLTEKDNADWWLSPS